MKTIDLAIIGGGPAGMAAALAAWEMGVCNIIIFERDNKLGGILGQCIHHGFGLHKFHEELTGPEYADRYITKVKEAQIPIKSDTMVIGLNHEKVITYTNESEGTAQIQAKAVVLAMGCREHPRGALNICGTRPAGIYTAGTAQKFVNFKGLTPGKDVVILGSGDIGLIMARRMVLEGARVRAVCEIMPQPGGLARNVAQCLDDFGIPLKLNSTVTEIHGRERLTGVTVSCVNTDLSIVSGSEEFIPCDTLLLSVGLLPENELSKKAGIILDENTGGPLTDGNCQTSVEGIFACGNVRKVHDLVDHVSDEAEIAGHGAVYYILGITPPKRDEISTEKAINIQTDKASYDLICTVCPTGCALRVGFNNEQMEITGNKCSRGKDYAKIEYTSPKRTLTTTVRIEGGGILPVRSESPLPKSELFRYIKIIKSIKASSETKIGDVVVENISGIGVNIIAAGNAKDV